MQGLRPRARSRARGAPRDGDAHHGRARLPVPGLVRHGVAPGAAQGDADHRRPKRAHARRLRARLHAAVALLRASLHVHAKQLAACKAAAARCRAYPVAMQPPPRRPCPAASRCSKTRSTTTPCPSRRPSLMSASNSWVSCRLAPCMQLACQRAHAHAAAQHGGPQRTHACG